MQLAYALAEARTTNINNMNNINNINNINNENIDGRALPPWHYTQGLPPEGGNYNGAVPPPPINAGFGNIDPVQDGQEIMA